jgi:hypothetical protein
MCTVVERLSPILERCARYYAAYQDEVDAYVADLERAEASERVLSARQRAIFS